MLSLGVTCLRGHASMTYGQKEEEAKSGGAMAGGDAQQEVESSTPQGDSDKGGERSLGGSERGCVYFVETEDGQFVKIGYSATLDRRMGQLESTLGPLSMRLIGYLPGNRG